MRFRMRAVIEMIAGLALAIPTIQISHYPLPKVAAAANRPIVSDTVTRIGYGSAEGIVVPAK